MTIIKLFESWQKCKTKKSDWGLTWFLASEICKRYYSSHGIVPLVIKKDGLGFYGILFSELACSVNKSPRQLGRLTMFGNTENWISGGIGDHGHEVDNENNATASTLIADAINYLELNAFPQVSHLSCRHKRWGDSYVLCFEIAACIALRYGTDKVAIWNHTSDIRRHVSEYDPKMHIKEHPGGFLFMSDRAEVFLSGDGRLLYPQSHNIWEAYMHGESTYELSNKIIEHLSL